jgi:hypothetical protein
VEAAIAISSYVTVLIAVRIFYSRRGVGGGVQCSAQAVMVVVMVMGALWHVGCGSGSADSLLKRDHILLGFI